MRIVCKRNERTNVRTEEQKEYIGREKKRDIGMCIQEGRRDRRLGRGRKAVLSTHTQQTREVTPAHNRGRWAQSWREAGREKGTK